MQQLFHSVNTNIGYFYAQLEARVSIGFMAYYPQIIYGLSTEYGDNMFVPYKGSLDNLVSIRVYLDSVDVFIDTLKRVHNIN